MLIHGMLVMAALHRKPSGLPGSGSALELRFPTPVHLHAPAPKIASGSHGRVQGPARPHPGPGHVGGRKREVPSS